MNGSGQPGKFSTVTVSSNCIMLCVTCCWKVHVVKTCDWGAENAEFVNLIFLLQLFFFSLCFSEIISNLQLWVFPHT